MSYFREFRNVELSLISHLRTQINANWTGVTTVKTYKQATEASLPVVCIRLLNVNPIPKEIGTTTRLNQFGLVIDIFAKNDGQRLDLASFLTDELNQGFVYYEHTKDSGAETLSTVANGRVRLLEYTQNQRIDFGDDVDSHDRFRHIIAVNLQRTT